MGLGVKRLIWCSQARAIIVLVNWLDLLFSALITYFLPPTLALNTTISFKHSTIPKQAIFSFFIFLLCLYYSLHFPSSKGEVLPSSQFSSPGEAGPGAHVWLVTTVCPLRLSPPLGICHMPSGHPGLIMPQFKNPSCLIVLQAWVNSETISQVSMATEDASQWTVSLETGWGVGVPCLSLCVNCFSIPASEIGPLEKRHGAG